jgi:hypothetical protein
MAAPTGGIILIAAWIGLAAAAIGESRYASSQYRRRNAKLHHLTYRARKVPELSPAENQKQRREKKTGRKNELIVDAVYKHALFRSIMRNLEE